MALPKLTEWALRLDDLSVARGRGPSSMRAVDGVRAELPFGSALVVSGPTGSGKSSLALALSGRAGRDTRIVGGSAVVCGISPERRGRARNVLTFRVGFLSQDAGPGLDPDRTVGELISLPLLEREPRLARRQLEIRVSNLLDEVRLPLGAAGKFPHELSSGMRQRVALAVALVLDPRLLIADEPLAGIDIEVRHVVRDAILRRREEWGMAALIVSNDVEFAQEIGAEQLVLDRGSVVGVRRAGEEPLITPGAREAHAFLGGA
ncbi:hypothetical protein GCM10010910_05490 [Microbacterium nanhaiense]|uniref:ABC transporter domain-containing protein n=1 Tax=Microbacterium nanhaiense TaxID=1301026 RepID=A0ABQ2N275_9MICO|nr:ATP-binding cassette domain-containing protein [Microbacterium nanhaiense]GGO60323.1 hypothetical protein GCM10010910_05490 [Microbacterium nanhaiense]